MGFFRQESWSGLPYCSEEYAFNLMIHIFHWLWKILCCCCSATKSLCPTLWPCALKHTALPCPSLSPGVCSHACPSHWWCHPTSSSSVAPFSSSPQSFPASGSFPMSWLFLSGGQSIGASASETLILKLKSQHLTFRITGLISCLVKCNIWKVLTSSWCIFKVLDTAPKLKCSLLMVPTC